MSKYIRLTFVVALILLTACLGSDFRRTSYLSPGADIRVRSTTTGTVSVKLSDIPVGKVIQVGELKFVKVGEDEWMATRQACIDELAVNGIKTFEYVDNNMYSFVACAGHTYKLEVWGAQGGLAICGGKSCGTPGSGGYSYGNIKPNDTVNLTIVVGGKGADAVVGQSVAGGYNGGGNGTWDGNDDESAGGGGGATHISSATGVLSSFSNVTNASKYVYIVAGGGGGEAWKVTAGGDGGGTTGGANAGCGKTATQTAGNSFGQGGHAIETGASNGTGGGGGGWYGGYAGGCGINDVEGYDAGGGGSGYLSSTFLVAGTTGMQTGGHSGNGYARITRLN